MSTLCNGNFLYMDNVDNFRTKLLQEKVIFTLSNDAVLYDRYVL